MIAILALLCLTCLAIKRITQIIMKDPEVNTFLFNDASYYTTQHTACRNVIVKNTVYVVSCMLLWGCLLVTSYDVALLYVLLQIFICCFMHDDMSKTDKLVLVVLGGGYWVVQSLHAKNLMYYAMFSLPVFSYKTIQTRIVQSTRVDFKILNFVLVYFIGFWVYSLYLFTRTPSYIDAVLIPATFYYDVCTWKNVITELSTKEKSR